MCNTCIHKIVCSKYIAMGEVTSCEHHREDRKGRWVDRYGEKYANKLYECYECKKPALYKFKVDELGHEYEVQDLTDYCPNCGADMRGK